MRNVIAQSEAERELKKSREGSHSSEISLYAYPVISLLLSALIAASTLGIASEGIDHSERKK